MLLPTGVCVCVYGFHVYKGVLVYVLCTQCITIFKQPATWTRTIVKATSTLKIQSSAKHCTSVNYCWKLFWSQLDSYILVWLHGLGLHTLIIYFLCVCWHSLVAPMQSFERCDFMQRKSTDDNVWVRSTIFFSHPLSSKQIFAHKSSIAVWLLCCLWHKNRHTNSLSNGCCSNQNGIIRRDFYED